MVRQKYELDETPDENQRLQNVTADINHDVLLFISKNESYNK